MLGIGKTSRILVRRQPPSENQTPLTLRKQLVEEAAIGGWRVGLGCACFLQIKS